MASDLLLTDKGRARLTKVRDMLEKGISPYAELAAKGQMGIQHIPKKTREDKPTATKIVATPKPIKSFYKPTPMEDLDLGVGEKQDPFKVYCSFCGHETDIYEATIGTGKLRKIVKHDLFKVGSELVYEEKVIHVTDKLTACPDCCLRIKPIMADEHDKDGNVMYDSSGRVIQRIVRNAVKFPDFD